MKKTLSVTKIFGCILIIGMGFIIIISFTPNFAKLYEIQAHYSFLKQKLLLEEKVNSFLKTESNGLSNDPYYIEKVAREKLGWCHPAETVYHFQTTLPNNSSSDSAK